MPNIFSFSEDMLPRHFPKSKKQLEQIPVVVVSDKNNVPKVVIKKSFQKWKEQHEAIFFDNRTEQLIKSEKKQVNSFDRDGSDHKRQSLPNQRIHPLVTPSLELSYYESLNCQRNNNCCPKQQQSHPNFNECHSRNILKSKPSSQAVVNGAHKPQYKINLRRYAPVQRTESMKENFPTNCCCRKNDKCCQTSNHQATDAQAFSQGEHWKERVEELEPLPLRSDRIFVKIMEEQQQHILFQQNQIKMHEKNNLEQQKQICMLQLRIQQLLLRNEANEIKSPNKAQEYIISDKMSPEVIFNVLNTRNYPTQTDCESEVGSSNDIMHGSIDELNDIHKFNETNITNYGKENVMPNIKASEDYSRDDVFLNRMNGTTKNSSAVFNCRINGYASNHSDINITSHTLIYEASSTNFGTNDTHIHSQKASDSSFALHMLGMKYKCNQESGSSNTDQRGLYYNQSSLQSNDRLSEKKSSDTHYLIRHGLIRK